MDDSNSNISSGSSTVDDVSNKSSEEPVNSSSMGIVQQMNSNIGTITTSTSFSNSDVDNFATSTSFQGISSGTGASSLTGSQSRDSSLDGDHSLDTVFHTKRKLHGKDKKVCRVCGDKALGYNFNAMTCESCKAFFRRNALKQSTPNCMFQGNCVVDTRTRRFCPHCRLKKCFSMGMKKEMILDLEQLKSRRDKIAKNKQLHRLHEREMTFHCDLEHSNGHLEHSHGDPEDVIPVAITEYDEPLPGPSRCSDEETEALHEGSKKANFGTKKEIGVKRSLKSEEQQWIQELTENHMSKFVFQPKMIGNAPDKTVEDFINVTKGNTGKLINYFKCVNDFIGLDKDTQISILKVRMLHSLILRSTYDYEKETHTWKLPDVEEPVSCSNLINALGPKNEEALNEVFKFSVVMKEEFGQDPSLYAILYLIIIFNPCIPGLTCHQKISDLQTKYIMLLKHYLESKFSFGMCKHYLPMLLSELNVIEKLGEHFNKVLLEMPLSDIDPLMTEVFSL